MKKIFLFIPIAIYKYLTWLHGEMFTKKSIKTLKLENCNYKIGKKENRKKNSKTKILFYHISGLSFGGTEKHLQILAKHINKEVYDVYFMYSPKPRGEENTTIDGRKNYLQKNNIKLISFDYESIDKDYPYTVRQSNPSIFDVIRKENIDLLVTADAGYNHFPINLIREIPIIYINVFGAIHNKKNIAMNICVSNTIVNKIKLFIPKNKISIMYVPSEKPLKASIKEGELLRKKLGIQDTDMAFGRIGRAVDSIFDPIGIRAFQRLVTNNKKVHYIIMAPPPALQKIVKEDSIPNVHFLDPTFQEKDIWAFHQAIDCLAHFRKDGETFGLTIAESMLCGNPIITHKSKIDNAHLEYLSNEFSRVARIDNVSDYYSHMSEFTDLKDTQNSLKKLGDLAKKQAEKLFLIDTAIVYFEETINNIITNN